MGKKSKKSKKSRRQGRADDLGRGIGRVVRPGVGFSPTATRLRARRAR